MKVIDWNRYLPQITGCHWYKCRSCNAIFFFIIDMKCPLCGGDLKRINGGI